MVYPMAMVPTFTRRIYKTKRQYIKQECPTIATAMTFDGLWTSVEKRFPVFALNEASGSYEYWTASRTKPWNGFCSYFRLDWTAHTVKALFNPSFSF